MDYAKSLFVDPLSNGTVSKTATVSQVKKVASTKMVAQTYGKGPSVTSRSISTARVTVNKSVKINEPLISDSKTLGKGLAAGGFALDVYSAGQAWYSGEGDINSFSTETAYSAIQVAAPKYAGGPAVAVSGGFAFGSAISGGRVPSDFAQRGLRSATSSVAADKYAQDAVDYLLCEGVPVECLTGACGDGGWWEKKGNQLAIFLAVAGYRDTSTSCGKR